MKLEVDPKELQSFFIALILFSGIILIIKLIKPMIGALCMALMILYFLNPLVNLIEKKLKIHLISVLIAFIIFIFPLSILIFLFISKVQGEISCILKNKEILDQIMVYLPNLYIQISNLNELITSILAYKDLLSKGFSIIHKIAWNLIYKVIQAIIGIFTAIYILIKKKDIEKAIYSIRDDKLLKFLKFIDQELKHVFYSIFITAFVTGLLSIPIYWYFKLPYVITLSTLTTVLTLIPIVGAWLVYLPLTIYIGVQEGVFKALIFLILCFTMISTLPDIIVRPFVASYSRKVDILAISFGFLCGMIVFGAAGIIIGPLVVIIAFGFIKIYLLNE